MTQTLQKTPGNLTVTEPFLEKFRHFESVAKTSLLPFRKAGLALFAELGFPTLHHEDWRFTNVQPLAKLPFQPVFQAPAVNGAETRALDEFAFTKLAGTRLVFVNGHYSSKLSTVGKFPSGVKVGSLAAALASDPALVEKYLGRCTPAPDNAFAALNQAFFLDGAFVQVPEDVDLTSPIQLVYICSTHETGATVSPRNLIVAGANSRVTIVESYIATVDTAYFTNAVTEIFAGDHAYVEHLKFQDEAPVAFHIAAIHGEFGHASNVNIHSFALGAKLSRNSIRTKLAGERLECILNGLYLTRGEQLADHHMIVEHAQPHCASHEYFNGILDDKSKGVFHGRILVQQIAQKTDAKQTNKNLLLSDDASADTKPQLEIYADDVKCTHGATIGQLNDESIFYLRSRGIGTDTARQMLIHAFAGEIIERIKCEPVRELMDKLVWDRLELLHIADKK
jgi:Fe-S cluster assembly protein SufD